MVTFNFPKGVRSKRRGSAHTGIFQVVVSGFVHVKKIRIQELFKDIQGHVSAKSRTKY